MADQVPIKDNTTPNLHPAKSGALSREEGKKNSGGLGEIRPPNEFSLDTAIPKSAVSNFEEKRLTYDHRIALIKSIAASAIALMFCLSFSLAFFYSEAADRASLLKDFLPIITGFLGFAGGTVASGTNNRNNSSS